MKPCNCGSAADESATALPNIEFADIDKLDARADSVRCVVVRIFSFVSGNLIHQERVTDPDLGNKVRTVLRSWGAKPFGQNGASISNC